MLAKGLLVAVNERPKCIRQSALQSLLPFSVSFVDLLRRIGLGRSQRKDRLTENVFYKTECGNCSTEQFPKVFAMPMSWRKSGALSLSAKCPTSCSFESSLIIPSLTTSVVHVTACRSLDY